MTDKEVKDTTVINRCVKQIDQLDPLTRKAVVGYLNTKYDASNTQSAPQRRTNDDFEL